MKMGWNKNGAGTPPISFTLYQVEVLQIASYISSFWKLNIYRAAPASVVTCATPFPVLSSDSGLGQFPSLSHTV